MRWTDMASGSLCAIARLFVLILVLTSAGSASDTPAVSPRELHRELAAGKIRARKARKQPWVRPASVVDVSGYNATYYHLNIRIDATARTIAGELTMRAKVQSNGYSTPTLNMLDKLAVDSVTSFGRPVTWSHQSPFLYLTLDSAYSVGEEFELTIGYHGVATGGWYGGLWFGSSNGKPSVATLSEPYLAQSWWPCKDTPSDKADSMDITITVDDRIYAVSNGVLRDSVGNPDGTVTWSWHEGYPITTYLVSLAIADYERFDLWYRYGPGDADSMPVRFYSYADKIGQALTDWPVTVDQLHFFSDLFGEYPFVNEKYGMAHFTWGGAMEHQTVTSATDGNFGFTEPLIAHELAHQWWGDLITCRDWHHIWMNEGFASYSEALWEEHQNGPWAYRNYMEGMSYWGGGRIYVDDTTSDSEIFSTRVYDKGAWVLHMLRGVIGDSAFFATLRAYYNHPDFQYQDVVTEEFRDLTETVAGVDLDEFFADWIYGYYYPRYSWSYLVEPRTQDNFYDVFIHVQQYQSTSPSVFDMPIEIRFEGLGGAPSERIWNTRREQDYVFSFPAPPTAVLFDPDNWILKQASQVPYGLNVITDTFPDGTQYTPYHDSLVVKGGTPPYEFTVYSGALPSGVTLDPVAGVLSGVPLLAGTSTFSVRVFDQGHANSRIKTFTLGVSPLSYRPGDFNGDLTIDAVDMSALIDVVFFGAPLPQPADVADVNGDCAADAIDVAYIIDAVFFGGAMPVPGCIE